MSSTCYQDLVPLAPVGTDPVILLDLGPWVSLRAGWPLCKFVFVFLFLKKKKKDVWVGGSGRGGGGAGVCGLEETASAARAVLMQAGRGRNV